MPSAQEAMADLARVFDQYAAYNQRSMAELLRQLAEKLQIDLYMECSGERANQKTKIDALPQRLDYHINRRLARSVGSNEVATRRYRSGPRKGQFKSQSIASQVRRESGTIVGRRVLLGARHVSVANEIRLRKRFAAFFQASGWLNSTIRRLTKPFRMVPEAVKVEQLGGTNLRVTITNPRPNSAEFGESSGYIARAFQNRAAEMQTYIQRKMNGDAQEFNRPHPNFTSKSIEAAVSDAMRGAFSKAA